MAEQILLSSGSFDRVREIGGFGQPLHTLYPQIQAVLANELGADAANLLAEPVVDRTHNRIDWYVQGDPDCKPIVLSELPEEQRQPVLAQIQSQLQRGRELAERYAASGDPQRMQLGAMLKAALGPPTETNIFLIKDQPVLAHWGFAADRPWETGGPVHHSPAPPLPSEASRDVAIPDITMPGLASSAVPPAPAAESPEQSESPLEPSSGLPSEKPAAAFADTIAPPPLPPPPPPPLPPPEPAGSMETETPIPLLLKSSPPSAVDRPGALLRYVVVGSRYFWSVAVLAVLLALGTFLWVLTRTSMHPLVNGSIQTLPDVTSDASLREAWHTEQALRTELEQRLIQLAAQRGRCPLPVETEEKVSPAFNVPAPNGNKATVTAAAEEAHHDETPSTRQPAHPGTGVKQPAPAGDVATALEPNGASDQTTMSTPVSPDRETPPAPPSADLPIPVNTSQLDKDRSLADTASPPQAPEESLAQTLEKALQKGSQTALNTPASQPPAGLPMQAEPTPEERQEFTSRLSATGAATGEITATLLWNGNADLDLVVYCPSGQMLDYQNPKECGGTLDVDANTARNSLSDRPVENVFWPAGQAAPGTYQIAVRYAPRKDEQHPQPTPFQIRLIRNNQEKVFKGTVQPRKAAPVTGFTVER